MANTATVHIVGQDPFNVVVSEGLNPIPETTHKKLGVFNSEVEFMENGKYYIMKLTY